MRWILKPTQNLPSFVKLINFSICIGLLLILALINIPILLVIQRNNMDEPRITRSSVYKQPVKVAALKKTVKKDTNYVEDTYMEYDPVYIDEE